MKNDGMYFIAIIGLILAFFLPVTVNQNFLLTTIFDTEVDSFLEKVGIRVGLTFAKPEVIQTSLSDVDEEILHVLVKKFLVEYQEEHGFQKSYKVQLLISEKYKLKEKPGILDGIKNGFVAVLTPVLNVFKVPFGVIKLIFTGKVEYIIGYLLYLLISSFTCFISLLLMKAPIYYYLGFFIGVAIARSTYRVVTDS